MSYVLTVIHPPADGAAFGKATVFEPTGEKSTAAFEAARMLGDVEELWLGQLAIFSNRLITADMGADVQHESTGYTFRIDPITNAPHPCPCCRRIVLPADLEGALCGGCYTFDDTEQCLPENTAHATTEDN